MAPRIKDAKDVMIERVTCEDVVDEEQEVERDDEHSAYGCTIENCSQCREYWRDEAADIPTRGGY